MRIFLLPLNKSFFSGYKILTKFEMSNVYIFTKSWINTDLGER